MATFPHTHLQFPHDADRPEGEGVLFVIRSESGVSVGPAQMLADLYEQAHYSDDVDTSEPVYATRASRPGLHLVVFEALGGPRRDEHGPYLYYAQAARYADDGAACAEIRWSVNGDA